MTKDLEKSGLTRDDLKARPMDDAERNACGLGIMVSGYVIPYYSMFGKILPFYRCKLFDYELKYKQVKNTINHLYFAPSFGRLLYDKVHSKDADKTLIFVEGEKKAAALVKHGYLAVGLSGVDSWRNRILVLPGNTEFIKAGGAQDQLHAKVAAEDAPKLKTSSFAEGLEPILNYVLKHKFKIMIIYDTDGPSGVKFEVQRAAASFAYMLRGRGFSMPSIKQMILPDMGEEKMGVDDFLEHEDGGILEFEALFKRTLEARKSFPKHPNIRQYISRKLGSPKIKREDMQQLGMAVVAELDCRGRRMESKDEGQLYYFDETGKKLMRVNLNTERFASMQNEQFGQLMYNDYGLSPSADSRLMSWLGTIYSAEQPLEEVNPHRILARPGRYEDAARFQISDGQYVEVTAKGITIHDNGAKGFLFESGRVNALDVPLFVEEIRKQRNEPLKMHWYDVMNETRMRDKGRHTELIALLYYCAPWLYRWRGTQLPIEINVGEPGSGKSTIQEMRLMIQVGNAKLRNSPDDIRGWWSALANSGGLHVTDNIGLANRELRTKLSDEICRLVTEPQPHIETRKLYTTMDQTSIKVDNVFVFTAVAQPFLASDVLQRSIVVNYDKGDDVRLSYDANWKDRKLDALGGREGWLAHQCIVLQRFFAAIDEHWDEHYRAKYRLINVEQILRILYRRVFEMGDDTWIPQKLADGVSTHIAATDLALQGLVAFARRTLKSAAAPEFSTKEVTDWAQQHDDYSDCPLLINTRKLGIYLSSNRHMVSQMAGIIEMGKKNNKQYFTINAETVKDNLTKL